MAYAYYRSETVQTSQITGTLTNFPALFSRTHNDFRTVGNGGHVQNANGYDLNLFSDAGLTTMLKMETQLYVASTGQVIKWAKVPSIAVATNVYWGYGDSGVSTSQDDPTNVWNSNFVGVYHDGTPSSLGLNDSTTNANTLTNNSATAAAGPVYAAAAFNASAGQTSASTGFQLSTWGIGVWVWFNSFGEGVVTERGASFGGQRNWLFYYNSGSGTWDIGFNDGGFKVHSTGVLTPAYNAWSRMWFTFDGSTIALYISGASILSDAEAHSPDISSGQTLHWGENNFGAVRMNGYLAERQVLSTAPTSAWIAADYNNQVAPTSFWSLGSETPFGGGGGGAPTSKLPALGVG